MEEDHHYRSMQQLHQQDLPTFMFLTPERLLQPQMSRIMTKLYSHQRIARFVIDEAHCILQVSSYFLLQLNLTYLWVPVVGRRLS